MHPLLALTPVISLAALGSTSTSSSTDYDPSLPFRPQNISGLIGLYNLVGSYYNGSTNIEITPLWGRTVNDTVCPNLRDNVYNTSFNSILGITEPNGGQNPVNTYLSLWEPGADLSSLPDSPYEIQQDQSLEWLFKSANWPEQGSLSLTGETTDDNFNYSLTRTTHAPYSLSAQISDVISATDHSLTLKIPACNSRRELDKWSLGFFDTYRRPKPPHWDRMYPNVSVMFNANAASLSIDAYFTAAPFLILDPMYDPKDQMIGHDSLNGKIRIAFQGTIDEYHSDVLMNRSATPDWLRSVGFGNFSGNIRNATSGGGSLGTEWMRGGGAFGGLFWIFGVGCWFLLG